MKTNPALIAIKPVIALPCSAEQLAPSVTAPSKQETLDHATVIDLKQYSLGL
jgi:hypothetical protein